MQRFPAVSNSKVSRRGPGGEHANLFLTDAVVVDERAASPIGPGHEASRGMENGPVHQIFPSIDRAVAGRLVAVRSPNRVIVHWSCIQGHKGWQCAHQADREQRGHLRMKDEGIM